MKNYVCICTREGRETWFAVDEIMLAASVVRESWLRMLVLVVSAERV